MKSRVMIALLGLSLSLSLSGVWGEPAQTQTQNAKPGPVRPADVHVTVEPFERDGHRGWKVALPGRHPLATPAVTDGKVFLGGGFGSHEFYALDATTGQMAWVYHTADDGPTAAVSRGGYIAFNTESCELEILTPRGRPLWKKWLGDPLMSMPAIEGDRVYMAYPDSRGDHRHHLACFVAATGKELWKQPLAGEIITAPVVSGGRVYLATLGGVVYCFDAVSGRLLWSEQRNATSSPAVHKGVAYYSQRQETVQRHGSQETRQQNEQVAVADGPQGNQRVIPASAQTADYLDYGKKSRSASERAKQSEDANVGFAGSKGDAKMAQANANLGEGSVYGVWSYQGSRPFLQGGRLFTAMGDTLKCVEVASGKEAWHRKLQPKSGRSATDRTLAPPVLVNCKVFVATSYGVLEVLSAKTGEMLWSVNIGEPLAFQPAVAAGRVYVPGSSGTLYCVETGDPADDGWAMWGGNAAHNGGM